MCLCLEGVGYCCVDMVYEYGEFVVCGVLIDLFLMGSELFFCIDLFDDEIEILCIFDLEIQCFIDKVELICLLLVCEFFLNKEVVIGFCGCFCECFDVDYWCCLIYQDFVSGLIFLGIEYYLLLFFEEIVIFFDYLL